MSLLKEINDRQDLHINQSDLDKTIFGFLPQRRLHGKSAEEFSHCDTLNSSKSFYRILPGYEGIPINMFMNLCLTTLIVIGMVAIVWYIKKTKTSEESGNKGYIKNSWFYFIYARKKSNQNILYSTKVINRDHPNAYLPLYLHPYHNMIRDQMNDESKTPDLDLYRRTATKNSKLKANTRENRVSSPVSGNRIKDLTTIRSKSESIRREGEKSEMSRLKSVLWNEEMETEISSAILSNESEVSENEKSICKWISKYLLIKDEDIFKKEGSDALQYLLFQRYLIYFLICLTIICLVVILPTNLYGNRLNNRENSQFKKTTLINVHKNSNLIWIHALMTLMIIAMGLFLMFSFSKIIDKREINIDKRILLIENIPESQRNAKSLEKFLKNKFPELVVNRIIFVYKTNKIKSLLMDIWTAISTKRYCIHYMKMYGQRCEVRPYFLGSFWGIGGCCQYFPKVDGIQYYDKEKIKKEDMLTEEMEYVISHPHNKAFVKFNDKAMATEVYKYFFRKHGHCYMFSKFIHWMCGHESDPLESWQWYVSYAPFPDDIEWTDIAVSNRKEWILYIAMNLLIIFVFIFVSTPTSAYNIIKNVIPLLNKSNNNSTETTEQNVDPVSEIFWLYIPTVLLMLMTSVLPALIKLLTTLIPCRTKSGLNYSIMFKSYIFLLLMVLILPSLELISSFSLIENSVKVEYSNGANQTKPIKYYCIFQVENGAYFLNYILTSALLGNALELTRVSDIATYFLFLLFICRNSAEYLSARQFTKFEFYFGTYYPRILLLFTLIVTFSISCPLIAPVGLFYMTVKHLVDRYLIHYVYVPSKINERIHTKAIFFVYISLFFLLLMVAFQLTDASDSRIPAKILGALAILYFVFLIYEFSKDLCDL